MVQMQMASQQGMDPIANNPIAHIQRLGLRNMYRGASATLLRDVPFAMLYFASYSRIKYAMQGDRERLTFFETLLAATAAALPASFFTTPADVLKTRLQVCVPCVCLCVPCVCPCRCLVSLIFLSLLSLDTPLFPLWRSKSVVFLIKPPTASFCRVRHEPGI